MSEVGGLQKHQNNPACTKHVKSLQNVETGHCTEEDGRRFCHLLRSCQSCLVFRFASGQLFHTTVLIINRYLSSFIIRDSYGNRLCAPSCSPWTLEVTSNMANTETEAGLTDVTMMANTETETWLIDVTMMANTETETLLIDVAMDGNFILRSF